MKNKISDLNNHLFAELERLGDEDLKGEALEAELNRAKGVAGIAEKIISSASLALRAEELKAEYTSARNFRLPQMIGEGKEEDA